MSGSRSSAAEVGLEVFDHTLGRALATVADQDEADKIKDLSPDGHKVTVRKAPAPVEE